MYSLEQTKPRMTIIGIVTQNVKVHGMGEKTNLYRIQRLLIPKGAEKKGTMSIWYEGN